MKKQSKHLLTAAMLLALCLALFFINRDIFQYETINLVGHTFSSDTETAGAYRLTSSAALKPARYQVSFCSAAASPQDRWALFDPDGVFMEGDFPDEDGCFRIPFELLGTTRSVEGGVIYGGGTNDLSISEIIFFSEHVLYKDSLLRHLTLSLGCLLLWVFLLLRFVYQEIFARTIGKWLTPSRERTLLFLILMTLVICCPYYRSDYVKGDDSTYHIARIEGVKTTLEAGIFPTRIHLFTLNNYGFASGIFYSDFFLLFPAVLRLLGFDFVICYKIFMITLTFFSLLSIYFCVTRLGGSRFAGFSAVILYGFNAYRLIDCYYRGAVGEILAFIFIPLVILGVYFIFNGASGRWWVLMLGMCGLVLSHLISTLLCLIFLSVFMLLFIGRILSRRNIFFSLLKAAIFTILLSCWFWLPMLEQMHDGGIMLAEQAGIKGDEAMPFKYLLANRTLWQVPVHPYIGYPLLFCPLLFFLPGQRRQSRFLITILYVFGLLSMLCATDIFPWQFFSRFQQNIQFTWRFLILTIPLLGTASALLIDQVIPSQSHRAFLWVELLFCLVCVFPIYQNTIETRWMESRGYKLENNRIGDGMYLPIGAEREFIDKNKDTVLCSDPSFQNLSHDRHGLSYRFDYQVQENEVSFEIPLLFYKGYQIKLTDIRTGRESRLNAEKGPHGLVETVVSGVPRGSITVYYQKTLGQHIADSVSLFAVFFLLTMFFRNRKKAR